MLKDETGKAWAQSEASGAESSPQVVRTPVDYVYRRCYVDKQGNTVDPRTFWDELLKYSKHGKTVLIAETADFSRPVAEVAAREIATEARRRAARKRIDMLEASYPDERARDRKRRKRKQKPRSEMNA